MIQKTILSSPAPHRTLSALVRMPNPTLYRKLQAIRKRVWFKFLWPIVVFLFIFSLNPFISTAIQSWTAARMEERRLTYSIGEVRKVNREDIAKLAPSLGIEDFNRSLDDRIIRDYHLFRIYVSSTGRPIIDPVKLEVFAGTERCKILDAKPRILNPVGKSLPVTFSLPHWKWVYPGTVSSLILSWSYDHDLDRIAGFNLYRSRFPNLGFGRVNSEIIKGFDWRATEPSRSDDAPVYYRLTAVSIWGLESEGAASLEAPNMAAFSSFAMDMRPGEIGTLGARLQSDPESAFLRGRLTVTFAEGLDSDAELEIYVLCKVPAGTTLTPSAFVSGAPSVRVQTDGRSHSLSYTVDRKEASTERADITPESVTAFTNGRQVFLCWRNPKTAHISGVRVFRASARDVGELEDLGTEVYSGPGDPGPLEALASNPWYSSIPRLNLPRVESDLEFREPPSRPQQPVSPPPVPDGAPAAPSAMQLLRVTEIEARYYVDEFPSDLESLTYTVFGYNDTGTSGYPVTVNISRKDASQEIVYRGR